MQVFKDVTVGIGGDCVVLSVVGRIGGRIVEEVISVGHVFPHIFGSSSELSTQLMIPLHRRSPSMQAPYLQRKAVKGQLQINRQMFLLLV